jgi:tRNA(fMet)-specific endonuclease VapC
MKNIVLDTCVIIHIIRQSKTGQKCMTLLKEFDANPNIIISVVTKGELESFAKQQDWGQSKINILTHFLTQVTYIDIENADKKLIEGYSKIDAFSKRKIPDSTGNLKVGSAHKMGKNDLWIAASAYAINAPLLTADGDFDHLNGTFFNVMKVI